NANQLIVIYRCAVNVTVRPCAFICFSCRLSYPARSIFLSVSAGEIDSDKKRDKLNRRRNPEGSEDRRVAHVLWTAVEAHVRLRAVDQERGQRRTYSAGETGN